MAVVKAAGVVVLVLAGMAPPATAQHDHASPYAGYQDRDIKALSPEQVEQYANGEGMGFALAAELNHYPGPKHVLEMAAGLALTETQIAAIRTIGERMRAAAVALGDSIVEEERRLDRDFADRTIDVAALTARTSRLGALEGTLRAVHLAAHLEVVAVLTPEQIARYDDMRGYR